MTIHQSELSLRHLLVYVPLIILGIIICPLSLCSDEKSNRSISMKMSVIDDYRHLRTIYVEGMEKTSIIIKSFEKFSDLGLCAPKATLIDATTGIIISKNQNDNVEYFEYVINQRKYLFEIEYSIDKKLKMYVNDIYLYDIQIGGNNTIEIAKSRQFIHHCEKIAPNTKTSDTRTPGSPPPTPTPAPPPSPKAP